MMEPVVRASNLAVLERKAPALAARIAQAAIPPEHVVRSGPDGEPHLLVRGAPLDHASDAKGAALRWAASAEERLRACQARRAVVVGLGLGYHLEALASRTSAELAIVEPDPAVWRLALGHRDLAPLLERAQLYDGPGARPERGLRTAVLPYAPALLVPGGHYRRCLDEWRASALATGLALRILVVSPMYGGSWPLAGQVARALLQLGHDARLLDLAPFHPGFREIDRFGARRLRRGELEARYCDVLASGVAAATEAVEPDLVIALAQAPLGAEALDAIARCGALRALWFVEDFRRMTYWRELAAHYDYVFTIQEGECLEQMRAVTDGQVGYLPCGFEPEVHRPLALSAQEQAAYGSDVSFVGAGYRNRRKVLRRFLDLDFRVWGSDWGGAVELADALQRAGARISTEESVRIFNATRVNLNLHSSTYHDDVDPRGDFVNPRTFELAGCGSFQIVDRRASLPAVFSDGTEVIGVSSGREMYEATRHYLARPEERRTIAERARSRALAEHTSVQRMQALLGAIVARHGDRLLARARTATIGEVAAQSEGSLQEFLGRLDGRLPFTIDEIVRSVPDREGHLADAEAIFLFLHQFDELYLREARA
jgi:spore maturation protein CgeB